MAFDLSAYQEGDEFEGSPGYLGKVISAILAEGGTLDYEGSSVIITSLPNRVAPVIPEPVAPVVPEPVAPVIPEAVAPSAPEPAPKPSATAKPRSYGRPRKSS